MCIPPHRARGETSATALVLLVVRFPFIFLPAPAPSEQGGLFCMFPLTGQYPRKRYLVLSPPSQPRTEVRARRLSGHPTLRPRQGLSCRRLSSRHSAAGFITHSDPRLPNPFGPQVPPVPSTSPPSPPAPQPGRWGNRKEELSGLQADLREREKRESGIPQRRTRGWGQQPPGSGSRLRKLWATGEPWLSTSSVGGANTSAAVFYLSDSTLQGN